jgi:hypothetical protein
MHFLLPNGKKCTKKKGYQNTEKAVNTKYISTIQNQARITDMDNIQESVFTLKKQNRWGHGSSGRTPAYQVQVLRFKF